MAVWPHDRLPRIAAPYVVELDLTFLCWYHFSKYAARRVCLNMHAMRDKTFPVHLNPNNFKVEDFEDPCEAFYWFGVYSSHFYNEPTGSQMHEEDTTTALEIDEKHEPQPTDSMRCPLAEVADFCAFDTETSGLSNNDCAVQVAVGFFRADGTAMGYYNKLWKLPAGVFLSSRSVKIHGITKRRLEQEGADASFEIRSVHRIFDTMKKRGKPIVAHNASFDIRILKQTAEKHKFDGWSIEVADVFCTMRNSKERCGLVSTKTGRLKAPSNAELYQTLFGQAPQGQLHDAITDIKVTGKCFYLGSLRGWWDL